MRDGRHHCDIRNPSRRNLNVEIRERKSQFGQVVETFNFISDQPELRNSSQLLSLEKILFNFWKFLSWKRQFSRNIVAVNKGPDSSCVVSRSPGASGASSRAPQHTQTTALSSE